MNIKTMLKKVEQANEMLAISDRENCEPLAVVINYDNWFHIYRLHSRKEYKKVMAAEFVPDVIKWVDTLEIETGKKYETAHGTTFQFIIE